ncbi:retrotransposon protein, putative, ty1-copia subclass [Tanacetum coccineum]
MHGIGKTVNELHAMLHEQTQPKQNAPALHNLAELLKNMKLSQGASSSGIFTIELNTFLNRSWIYDTGCGTHICNTTQGLRASRKLKSGALSLNNMVYFSAIPKDGIFEIDLSNSYANDSSMYAVSNKRAKLDLESALLWHCHLGHISKKRIEKLQHDGLLNSTDLRSFEKCVPCMSGKMARKHYTHQVERAKDLLGLICTDVCGPFKIMSRQGASYFITFTDDFSRYGYVYLLKNKHEVFETFKVFQKEAENQLGKTIKSLRSDHGGEYMTQEFLYHLKDHEIIAHRTPPYTPQHSAVSERKNRTQLDMALVKRDTLTKPDKLEPMSIKCIFIGYIKETMGYSFYYPPENKVLVARNVEFLKNSLITQEASGSLEDHEIIQEEDTHPFIDTSLHHEEDDLEIDEPQSDIVPIRRFIRTRHAPDQMCLYIDVEEHKLGDLDNEVWDLFDLPPNGKTVGSKWLFKKKTDIDGAVHTDKARLVAKGYSQTLGIDYEETFYHVADIRAIRILIAIATFYDYEIWQMDVKTAFLNGYLSEEQASRKWNKRFDDEIKKFGFTQNCDEPCVYLKASGSNVTFLILYVVDILIMGNNIPMLQDVKSHFGRCFAKENLGEAAYILGIKIYRDRSQRLIGLCQSAYIEKILKRYHMESSKRGSIPMQEKLRLSKSQGASTPAELKRIQNVPYASVMGSIMYDMRCTRPDVAFAQNITSRFQ